MELLFQFELIAIQKTFSCMLRLHIPNVTPFGCALCIFLMILHCSQKLEEVSNELHFM
jgi:hypothetical protein